MGKIDSFWTKFVLCLLLRAFVCVYFEWFFSLYRRCSMSRLFFFASLSLSSFSRWFLFFSLSIIFSLFRLIRPQFGFYLLQRLENKKKHYSHSQHIVYILFYLQFAHLKPMVKAFSYSTIFLTYFLFSLFRHFLVVFWHIPFTPPKLLGCFFWQWWHFVRSHKIHTYRRSTLYTVRSITLIVFAHHSYSLFTKFSVEIVCIVYGSRFRTQLIFIYFPVASHRFLASSITLSRC